jgi:hypothetical protein
MDLFVLSIGFFSHKNTKQTSLNLKELKFAFADLHKLFDVTRQIAIHKKVYFWDSAIMENCL